ncbi:MAG TPA: nuclear transport factor 2 family protein, partial [Bryobacteraceae bacterium]|nr:nuclear transport factor 2 family protein [Bryobacteraceae bacterium]
NKLYASELVYEHSSAKNETKTESIENATKADGIPQSVQFHNPSIHVYGNTATFKSVGDFTNHAGAVSHLDVLMVWVKSGSGWQLVARQSTKIP